jgi:hypothetical protein
MPDNPGNVPGPTEHEWQPPRLTVLGDASDLTGLLAKSNPGPDGSSMS